VDTLSLENTDDGHRELTIHFETNNTYLAKLFGPQRASKIINGFIFRNTILYPMLVICNIGFLSVIQKLLSQIDSSIDEVLDPFVIYPSYGMWAIISPWAFLLFLSVNLKSFGMIWRSFDWFIKIINITLYVVLKVLYIHVQSTSVLDSRKTTPWLIYDIFYALFQILVILIWSSLDALQFRRVVMLYFGIVISLIFTLSTIYMTLWASSHDEDDDDSVVYITDSVSISLISMMDSALRVVTIFLWKQTIVSIVNRKHKKCILIKYSPFIEWVDTDSPPNDQQRMEQQIENNIAVNGQETADGPVDEETTKADAIEMTEVNLGQTLDPDMIDTLRDADINAVLKDMNEIEPSQSAYE